MAEVTLRDVRKSFDSTEIIHGVSLTVHEGEFVVFTPRSYIVRLTTRRKS